MNFSFAKDFCLWVVPSKDGRVRKLRFTFRSLALGASVLVLVSSGFIFIASDYARVQVLRAKNYLHLRSVTKERDQLISSQKNLVSEVEVLKDSNAKVLTYEKGVRERLQELQSLLRSANALVPIAEEAKSLSNEGGVGGAEVDCDTGSGDRCEDIFAADSSGMRASLQPAVFMGEEFMGERLEEPLPDALTDKDLIQVLDRYIDLLKIYPFSIPALGHMSSAFGTRVSPFTHRFSLHQGVDFSLSHGSHIVSTGDGVVRRVSRFSAYGLMVDVAHSDRVVTRYAHMSKAFVSEGEKVCRGEIIGLVGSTGRSTGPHLHYEVLVDGQPRDPMRFIEIAGKLQKIFG